MNADMKSCIELSDPLIKAGGTAEDKTVVYVVTNRCDFSLKVDVVEEGNNRNSITLPGNGSQNYECRISGPAGATLCKGIRSYAARCTN